MNDHLAVHLPDALMTDIRSRSLKSVRRVRNSDREEEEMKDKQAVVYSGVTLCFRSLDLFS